MKSYSYSFTFDISIVQCLGVSGHNVRTCWILHRGIRFKLDNCKSLLLSSKSWINHQQIEKRTPLLVLSKKIQRMFTMDTSVACKGFLRLLGSRGFFL